MKILSFIEPIAKAAYWLRYVLLLIAALSGGSFFYLVLAAGPEMDQFLLPIVVCLGWAVCLMGIAISFRLIPEKSDGSEGFLLKIRRKFGKAAAYFWICFFMLSSVILVYLSIRSIVSLLG